MALKVFAIIHFDLKTLTVGGRISEYFRGLLHENMLILQWSKTTESNPVKLTPPVVRLASTASTFIENVCLKKSQNENRVRSRQ